MIAGAECGRHFHILYKFKNRSRRYRRILVVGAGGLGCELLKDLALTGFGNIDVIDMDTIDASNLNRQFLFRTSDVGKSKATVAAERVMERISGVSVTAHSCMIQEKPREFYREFHVIVLGLDSLEARRYMNSVACSFLQYNDDGSPDVSTIKPIVDGGTEGFKGHARVLLPGVTPCFECTLWLFPPQVKYPLCTLAETPRSAPHCIEYAKIVMWPQEHPEEEFDGDNVHHVSWIYSKALERAESFGISGVTYQLTQGVVKNIIPAIASTNAIIAGMCTLETLKIITMCSTGLNNMLMYVGTDSIYTLTSAYEKDPNCIACSAAIGMNIATGSTLEQFIANLLEHPQMRDSIQSPSVSHGHSNLYMRGALEGMTRQNLPARLADLVGWAGHGPVTLTVNDKSLMAPLKVKVTFVD